MLKALAGALQERYRRIPTTDLYVRNPLAALARRSAPGSLPPLCHLGGNVYQIGRTGIVVRTGTGEDLDRLRAASVRRIVYVADDDFTAAAEDGGLPAHYRARLATFVRTGWPALVAAADRVIVPSPALAAIYSVKARIMHPVWRGAPAATGHFARPARFDIVHLGTASHAADFAVIESVIGEMLREHPQARLTLFGDPAVAPFRGHPQVRIVRPMAWWRYRLWLPRRRFHLALYPLRDTAWNAARSSNKLFEQALTGAAPLMSATPALLDAAGPGLAAAFVAGGADAWRRSIAADLAEPERACRRAEAAAARIRAFDAEDRAARLWSEILAEEAG